MLPELVSTTTWPSSPDNPIRWWPSPGADPIPEPVTRARPRTAPYLPSARLPTFTLVRGGSAGCDHLIEFSRMYNACMPNVQIRDVPEDVHNELVRRAGLAGQSLQQYLSAQLASMVATPTIDDMIARIERRSKGRLSRADAITAIEDDRARR